MKKDCDYNRIKDLFHAVGIHFNVVWCGCPTQQGKGQSATIILNGCTFSFDNSGRFTSQESFDVREDNENGEGSEEE